MPVTPQMLEMANLFRAQLLARERRAATAMVRYYGTTWQRIQTEAMRLAQDAQETRDAGEEVSEARIWQMERMQALQRQTEQELAKFAPFADATIQAGQREAIAAAQRQAPALTRAAFPRNAAIDIQFGPMHAEAIEALVGTLQDGSPLLDILEKYVGDAAERMQNTLVTDIALGYGPRKVAADIRREFGMGLSNALRLSRTEQLRAYRTATLASYQADPTVKGWERAAALDTNTCMACIMLDGKLYSTQDEMDDHPQGRCTMLPVTKTFREMGLDVDEPDFSRELGKDWFERQDEVTQRAMMGTGKFDAWQAGRFTLEDIPKEITSSVWGNSWVPRSLKDLAPGWTGGGVAQLATMNTQTAEEIRALVLSLDLTDAGDVNLLRGKLDGLLQDQTGYRNAIKNLDAGLDRTSDIAKRANIESALEFQRERLAGVQDKVLGIRQQIHEERATLWKALYVDNPLIDFDVRIPVEVGDSRRVVWEEGADVFRNLVGTGSLDQSVVDVHSVLGRAYASLDGRDIYLTDQGGRRQIIHELGHCLESRDPEIHRRALEFLDRRTAGETSEWLGDSHDQAEMTRRDKFLSPYMGKTYGGDATEIVSMGLEYLTANSRELARDDPEYFDFMIDILRGR